MAKCISRSGGSRNEAIEAGRPSVVWGSVNEKGNCGGECGVTPITNGDFAAIIEDMNKIQRHNSDGN